MSTPTPEEQLDALGEAVAQGVKSATSDGTTVESLPLKDRIEAIKFLEARQPGRKTVRLCRVIPPGAV